MDCDEYHSIWYFSWCYNLAMFVHIFIHTIFSVHKRSMLINQWHWVKFWSLFFMFFVFYQNPSFKKPTCQNKWFDVVDYSKLTGLDNLPTIFLKDAAGFIKPYVTHIISLSLVQGIFPYEMKAARAIVLFKKENKLDHNFMYII